MDRVLMLMAVQSAMGAFDTLKRLPWRPGAAHDRARALERAEMLLGGQRVLPKKAGKTGYQFLYPTLD
ncbi:MAG TPA: DUF1731 domain-containing protein, partial [Stellaceae bacterium]